MASGKIVHVRVQVWAGSSSERAIADWQRIWRRRGVHRLGKMMYPMQGAAIALELRGPAAAIDDLRARLRDDQSARIELQPPKEKER